MAAEAGSCCPCEHKRTRLLQNIAVLPGDEVKAIEEEAKVVFGHSNPLACHIPFARVLPILVHFGEVPFDDFGLGRAPQLSRLLTMKKIVIEV